MQEQKVAKENEELHKQYQQTSDHISVDLDKSTYEQTGNPKDIVLIPTNITFSLLDRWKDISENYSEINYPEELINQEDWVQVSKVLAKQSFAMDEVSIKIGEKYTEDPNQRMNPKTVYGYIYYNDRSEDYFQKFLEDNEIE